MHRRRIREKRSLLQQSINFTAILEAQAEKAERDLKLAEESYESLQSEIEEKIRSSKDSLEHLEMTHPEYDEYTDLMRAYEKYSADCTELLRSLKWKCDEVKFEAELQKCYTETRRENLDQLEEEWKGAGLLQRRCIGT